MTMNAGLFTSNRTDWETPDALFEALLQEFAFDVLWSTL